MGERTTDTPTELRRATEYNRTWKKQNCSKIASHHNYLCIFYSVSNASTEMCAIACVLLNYLLIKSITSIRNKMFRPLKLELTATANGVWLCRIDAWSAPLISWLEKANEIRKDKWSIFSIAFLFHLSSHSIRHSTYVERHLRRIRRLRLSFSPFVYNFTSRRHQQCVSFEICFHSMPKFQKWRKWKTWARSELLVPNPHNQMKKKKLYMYRNEDDENNVLLWDLERPLRTPCAIFLIQLAIFFPMAFFPHAKHRLLGWRQIEIWCEARSIVNSVLKGKTLLLCNEITWHSIYIIYVWNFVSIFFLFFFHFEVEVEVALDSLSSEFRTFI